MKMGRNTLVTQKPCAAFPVFAAPRNAKQIDDDAIKKNRIRANHILGLCNKIFTLRKRNNHKY